MQQNGCILQFACFFCLNEASERGLSILAYLLSGLLLLWYGGNAFVRGSVWIAKWLNVSQLMIGLTLVGLGSSLPELMTSVTAALNGAPGLVVGNIVGSNIANVLLILAIAALIRPIVCRPLAFYRDAFALVVGTVAGTTLIFYGYIGRVSGGILLSGIAVYIILVYRSERLRLSHAGELRIERAKAAVSAEAMGKAIVLVLGGLCAVISGAWLLVTGASELALLWGVSKTFVGLTIVAIGTSLPELVITGIASLRGRSDIALGNILGSNMFNILAILGMTAIVSPFGVPPTLKTFDVLVMLAATAVLIISAATNMRVTRWEGGALLAGYAIFLFMRAKIAA